MSDLRPFSEIANGVHWIKDRFVNAYLIEDKEDLILIDSGMNKKAKGILGYIKSELEDRNISKIYLTHHHMDHTGGMAALHDLFHPPIFVGEDDADVVTGVRNSPLPRNPIIRPFFWLFRPLMQARSVERVELLHDGMKTDNFEVYHLPGHTMGSMGFLKNDILFSGDAAVSTKGKVSIGMKLFAEDVTVAQYSLRKVAELEFGMMLPGHGTPIMEDASKMAKELVEDIEFS